jgi:hypothetical protein
MGVVADESIDEPHAGVWAQDRKQHLIDQVAPEDLVFIYESRSDAAAIREYVDGTSRRKAPVQQLKNLRMLRESPLSNELYEKSRAGLTTTLTKITEATHLLVIPGFGPARITVPELLNNGFSILPGSSVIANRTCGPTLSQRSH